MSKGLVKYRYCDVSMARSKGLIGNKRTELGKCRKECKSCIACIEVDTNGDKEHVDPKR